MQVAVHVFEITATPLQCSVFTDLSCMIRVHRAALCSLSNKRAHLCAAHVQIPDILLAFTQPQIEGMQRNLGKIWHR